MRPVDKDYRIYGERIYLRPIVEDDTDMVLEWRNSENVVKNFIYRKQITKSEHLEWLKNKVDKGLVHQFIICDNVGDTPYGCVYIPHFDDENNKAECGIFLGDNKNRPRGIGAEAMKMVLDYCFEQLNVHKVVTRVLAFNKASLKMNERAGYVQEAYLKDELYIDGKYEDVVLFGAVNPYVLSGNDENV